MVSNKGASQKNIHRNKSLFLIFLFPLIVSLGAQAQVGRLLWEDNFDSLNNDYWNIDIGDGCDIGLCGWGNQELQWYSGDNVAIRPVPGEAGNSALVLEARRQGSNGRAFTSGKVQSQNKIAVQYGMIETRIRVPNLETGLWPAAWMLGTSTQTWPRKGEIDMMEMGHRAEEKARQGHPGVSSNSFVGSNIIFYADAACVPGNPTCAASTAYNVDENKPYVSDTPMNDRFVIYRTYWTDQQLRFTIIDNGQEYDLYERPFTITEESSAMRAPFYLLLNLAVGGNFTDAAAPGEVTAPMAAPMYIDYVRVYEYNGQGEIIAGNTAQPESGVFGVFTETSATTNALEIGSDGDVYLWDTNSSEGSEAPFEGNEVIAWRYNNPGTWFGGGIQTRQARDMSRFAEGELRFAIKIPADIDFRIGITDTFTNEHWVDFPANESRYGLERNGEWGSVSIPIADLRGPLVAIQSVQYMFAISSDPDNFPNRAFTYAIDNVLWDSGVEDSDGDGVPDSQDQCPQTPMGTAVDALGCPIDTGPGDSDNDGVNDDIDACPNTPPGTSVDSQGCPVVIAPVDSDNDGVNDDIDACPNTPPGSSVDSQGCPVVIAPVDSDNDGVNDDIDACPNTPPGTRVDAQGCPVVADVYGLETSGANAIEFFVDTAAWADVHYRINGGPQQNVRMRQNAGRNTFRVNGLNDGDQLAYFFTYWDVERAFAVDTTWTDYTFRQSSQLQVVSVPASASASSEFQPAAYAVDGDPATRWESSHGVDPSSITFDLGSQRRLKEIMIDWEAANAEIYRVEASANGTSWSSIANFNGGTFGDRRDQIALSGEYRYLRIVGTKRPNGNYWGYSIWNVEIRAYAD